jgi:hypothetical protein
MVFDLVLLVGAATQWERYHKTLIVIAIAAFVLYIVLLYASMQ